MHYRIATLGDVPTLAQMRWDFRAEDGEEPGVPFVAFRERYHRVISDEMRAGRLVYWVAEADTTLVAHMAVIRIPGIPRPSRASDQWGYLTDCYTRPAFRDGRIGTTLLQHVQQWARTQDFELLLVAPSAAAESFYRRAGFENATTFRQCLLRAFDDAPPASDTP